MSSVLLLVTAAIWGFAFVAQRKGMESLDPLMFNAIRFALGAVFLGMVKRVNVYRGLRSGFVLGLLLFVAATLQQYGLVWTTAGNAGFITGLYVVFVPLIGLLRGQKMELKLWGAVGLAIIGMYYISNNQALEVSFGNAIVLISAIFWAWHVQFIDHLVHKNSPYELAFGQFVTCAGLSFVGVITLYLFQKPAYIASPELGGDILSAGLPILYGGLCSVGIAYTLQVYAQRKTAPSTAAIILCSEGIFALLGGYLLLGEAITTNTVIGALMILSAMLLSVLPTNIFRRIGMVNS